MVAWSKYLTSKVSCLKQISNRQSWLPEANYWIATYILLIVILHLNWFNQHTCYDEHEVHGLKFISILTWLFELFESNMMHRNLVDYLLRNREFFPHCFCMQYVSRINWLYGFIILKWIWSPLYFCYGFNGMFVGQSTHYD